MIRIGQCHKCANGKLAYQEIDNFKTIIVMTKSRSVWHPLSPYCLKDKYGRIFENIWQFSKLYPRIYKHREVKSRFDHTPIWYQDDEIHLQNNQLTPEYFEWRRRGMYSPESISYPNGNNSRHHECMGAFKDVDGEIDLSRLLSYIEARKEIYLPLYVSLVTDPNNKAYERFYKLATMLRKGTNLLILEIDGPKAKYLPYYQDRYNVPDSFIENGSMLATEDNLNLMLNDPISPFGHGYCLAWALKNLPLPISL